jgi:hypothetical protein
MKTLFTIFVAALMAGCSKPVDPVKLNDSEITWMEGYTNAHVFISVDKLQTNIPVTGLESALSVANQYGWKFVSSERDRYSETYHIQRAGSGDATISLIAELKP